LKRGLHQIHVYEVQPDNIRLCRHHLQDAPETVKLFEQAVWDTDDRELYLPDAVPVFEGVNNTGGFSLSAAGRIPVKTVSFDRAVERLTQGFTHRVRLLKLDAEGAEWPILLGSDSLRYVDEIVGEFHEVGGNYDDGSHEGVLMKGDVPLTRQLLRHTLSRNGFRVRCEQTKSRYGIFFATRFRTPVSWWRGYR
jgi:FkbM family methyltransferase